jgi:hypothetical protein
MPIKVFSPQKEKCIAKNEKWILKKLSEGIVFDFFFNKNNIMLSCNIFFWACILLFWHAFYFFWHAFYFFDMRFIFSVSKFVGMQIDFYWLQHFATWACKFIFWIAKSFFGSTKYFTPHFWHVLKKMSGFLRKPYKRISKISKFEYAISN